MSKRVAASVLLSAPKGSAALDRLHEMATEQTAPHLYAAVLNALARAVVIVDSVGAIVFANTAAESLFGYPCVELLGKSVEDLLPEALRCCHAEHRALYAGTHPPVPRHMGLGLIVTARRKSGVDIAVEVELVPVVTATGLFVAALVVAQQDGDSD